MNFSLGLLILLISTQLQAVEVYRCINDKGKVEFSQLPCGNDAAIIQVEPQPATIPKQKLIKLRNQHLEALEERSKRLKRRSLETRLKNLKGARNALIEKRNKKLDKLHKDLKEAYHFHEKEEIESKMRDVRQQYWSDRRRLNDKIDDTQMDLSSCCN
jgi:hypothetical protein